MGRGGCYVHRHATQKLLTYSSVDNLSLIHRTYPDTHTDCVFCVVSQRKCFSVARGREQGPDWFRTFPGALEGNEDTEQFMQGVLGCCCVAQASVEENDYCYFLSFRQGDMKRKTWPHISVRQCVGRPRDNRMLWILSDWIHVMQLLPRRSRSSHTRTSLSSTNNSPFLLLSTAVCFPSSRRRAVLADLQMIISQ